MECDRKSQNVVIYVLLSLGNDTSAIHRVWSALSHVERQGYLFSKLAAVIKDLVITGGYDLMRIRELSFYSFRPLKSLDKALI